MLLWISYHCDWLHQNMLCSTGPTSSTTGRSRDPGQNKEVRGMLSVYVKCKKKENSLQEIKHLLQREVFLDMFPKQYNYQLLRKHHLISPHVLQDAGDYENDPQGRSNEAIRMSSLYQNPNATTKQPDSIYQSLNLNTVQPDAVYQSLHPNTTKPQSHLTQSASQCQFIRAYTPTPPSLSCTVSLNLFTKYIFPKPSTSESLLAIWYTCCAV